MRVVFLLQHSYQYGKNSEHDETKTIGIFSSRQLAETAAEKYKGLTGFKDYSFDCFCIDEYRLDEKYWAEGFISL